MGTESFDVEAALDHLRSSDKTLGRAIDRIGAFEFKTQRTSSTFEALTEAIVYQQLHPRAAAAILGRFRSLFSDASDLSEAQRLIDLPDEPLRGAGLSGSKLLSIRDLARRTLDGTVPTPAQARRMSDQAVIDRLVEVRGIGTWTAQMFLIFRLGRPDVLPVDDFGIRKGYGAVFKKGEAGEKKEILARGERWAPYRSVASWYLWRVADLPSKKPANKPAKSTAP